jgi:hypothetical protein
MRTTIIITALTATSVLAFPAELKSRQNPNPAPNTQSCGASDLIDQVIYTIFIGEPFNQDTCNSAVAALTAAFNPSNPGCLTSGNGDITRIGFSTDRNNGNTINQVLDAQFPAVNGFNCPNF